MDYYLWSKPQNKPFFYTRSQQKASLAIVGRQESSPRGTWVQKWRTEHRLDAVTSLFQEAALVWNPHLLCDFDQFSPQWRARKGRVFTASKHGFSNQGCHTAYLQGCPAEMWYKDGSGPRVQVDSQGILTKKTHQIPKWLLDNLFKIGLI